MTTKDKKLIELNVVIRECADGEYTIKTISKFCDDDLTKFNNLLMRRIAQLVGQIKQHLEEQEND